DKSGTIGVDSSSAFRVGNGSQNKVRAVIRIGVSVVIVGNGLNPREATARNLNDDRHGEVRPIIPSYVEPAAAVVLNDLQEPAVRAVIQLTTKAVWIEYFSRLVIPIAAGEMNRATVSEIKPKLGPILAHIVQVIMDSFPGLRPVSFAALCEKGRERAGPSTAFKGFTIIRPIRANDFVFDAVPVGECNRDRALPILDCGVTRLVHRPSVRASRAYPSP